MPLIQIDLTAEQIANYTYAADHEKITFDEMVHDMVVSYGDRKYMSSLKEKVEKQFGNLSPSEIKAKLDILEAI